MKDLLPWLLLALWLPTAHAQNPDTTPIQTPSRTSLNCPAQWDAPLPNTPEASRQRLRELQALEEACETHPGFHAQRGQLLLQTGWPSEAATALEKSLLLSPDQPGVQLDYAQALAQVGQINSARQIIDTLIERPDTPPDLRQWLLSGLQPTSDAWAWEGMIQNSLGHETNRSQVTHTNSLTLYLPGGPVQVSLADNLKPIAGSGIKTTLLAQGLRPLGPGALRVTLSMHLQQAENTARNHLSSAQASYHWPMGPGMSSLLMGANHFTQINEYHYSDTFWLIKHQTPMTTKCNGGPFAGQVKQTYIGESDLSGQYSQAGLEIQCTHGRLAQTTLSLSRGNDQPKQVSRPGGAKQKQEITLRHDRQLTTPFNTTRPIEGTLRFWVRHHRTQDQALFSPLLGEQKTQTERNDVGIGYWWPLAPQWRMGIDMESTSQKSTNTLLNIKNSSLYIGIRWTSKP